MSDMVNRSVMASAKLGSWLSAALDDPNVCDEMKADIREWFSAGEPVQMLCDRIAAMQADAAPVADRVSTSSPVDVSRPGNTSGKLRDALEVWKDAYEAWCNPPPHLAFSESAAAVIEADRAALVAAIVADLRGHSIAGDRIADRIEAKWNGK